MSASRDRIVWLDLEMFSLEDPRVLECAVILTTCNSLDEVARQNWSIGISQQELTDDILAGSASHFHQTHSMQNGLIKECLASSLTHKQWQEQLLSFLKRFCFKGCRLAGFAVHCDRDVLRMQAPEVYAFLSHRIIDVQSLVIIEWGLPALERAAYKNRGGVAVNHRAMSDCEVALAKLKWYQAWLKNAVHE